MQLLVGLNAPCSFIYPLQVSDSKLVSADSKGSVRFWEWSTRLLSGADERVIECNVIEEAELIAMDAPEQPVKKATKIASSGGSSSSDTQIAAWTNESDPGSEIAR